jgi:Fe-S-cluster-containing dehydrogenase component/formate-dependent nitrite reductase membrane component NrfD
VNYGFLIDNRTCIGCHACSTACKMENEVPLGVFRTWVKQVDKGIFPDVRRSFQVTRCNHCANPPCVRICPVEAMYQRDDGIVDFDPSVCIGCKACLQACPYDAIYMDPNTDTAAKCHYCAHRVEVGLEPACVIVCPEHAIISGDLDDPTSEISRMVAQHDVTVRRPEQGTAPKLFYIEADEVALTPTASSLLGTFAFADVATDQAAAMSVTGGRRRPEPPTTRQHNPTGDALRPATTQGVGTWSGPLHLGGARVAEQMVQTVYNAQHKIPWHWPVPAYLVTKAMASGIMLILLPLRRVYPFPVDTPQGILVTLLALLLTGLTALLLILDLAKPERFYLIVTRPQWRSWLTRGAFILIAYTLFLGLWLTLQLGQAGEVWPRSVLAGTPLPLLVLGVGLAVVTAAYTAFLFGQAEGRDLWQSPLLPIHFVVQAGLAGTAVLVLVNFLGDLLVPQQSDDLFGLAYFLAGRVLPLLLAADLFLILAGEFGMPHASETAARAAREITHGRYRQHFWTGSILIGHVLPLGLLLGSLILWEPNLSDRALAGLLVASSLAVIGGLYAFEHAFVMAPQEVPNS